jgi:hypothetical protein
MRLEIFLFALYLSLVGSLDIWTTYIDRHYMKDILYPKLREFVGPEGKVLSIGFESYNSIDRTLANISIENWFINDIREVSVPPTQGNFMLGDLPTVAKTKHHFFKAIIDYGVLGFTPSKWSQEAIAAHIRSYSQLLEQDGRVFLKWDLFWPKENPQIWNQIHPQLEAHMIPHAAYLQADQRCPPQFKALITSKLHDVKWIHESYGFNWTGHKSHCDAYLHTVWRPRAKKEEK